MKLQRLPSFIIIGAMKCGTTSLFHYLGQHPELSPCRMKEPAFFARTNWDRGMDWYQSLFRDTHKLQFEASTDYTKYPNFSNVPERMAQYLPGIKLIYIVRHPLRRIHSHIRHNLVEGRLTRENLTREDFWEQEGQFYINCSRYYMQIQRYLTYFDRSQILLLHMEDLSETPMQVCHTAFAFLGLKNQEFTPSFARRFNTAEKRGRNVLERSVKSLRRVVPLPDGKKRRSPVAPPPMLSPGQRSYIWSQLQPDIRRFEEISGRALPYRLEDQVE